MKLPFRLMWLYYSQSQYSVVGNDRLYHVFYKTITGKVVEVTEARLHRNNGGKWKDYHFVGIGKFRHVEGVSIFDHSQHLRTIQVSRAAFDEMKARAEKAEAALKAANEDAEKLYGEAVFALTWQAEVCHDVISSESQKTLNAHRARAEKAEAENKRLQAELDVEQKAHDTIAKICFAVGVSSDNGTSISAVKNLIAKLDAANKAASFHPRAAKLMRKRKNFIVIACDEPYFMDAYDLIRDEETRKGTWEIEDQWHYDDAKAAHRARVGGVK